MTGAATPIRSPLMRESLMDLEVLAATQRAHLQALTNPPGAYPVVPGSQGFCQGLLVRHAGREQLGLPASAQPCHSRSSIRAAITAISPSSTSVTVDIHQPG